MAKAKRWLVRESRADGCCERYWYRVYHGAVPKTCNDGHWSLRGMFDTYTSVQDWLGDKYELPPGGGPVELPE